MRKRETRERSERERGLESGKCVQGKDSRDAFYSSLSTRNSDHKNNAHQKSCFKTCYESPVKGKIIKNKNKVLIPNMGHKREKENMFLCCFYKYNKK